MSYNHLEMDSTPRLTCQQCKQRKKKCDKGAPCSACKQAGLACQVVRRARLPRGRSGQARSKNSLLESRVARIEKLLHHGQASQYQQDDFLARHQNSAANISRPERPTEKTGDFVAAGFWSALFEEVAGLRETIESAEIDDAPPDDAAGGGEPGPASNEMAALFGHGPSPGTNRHEPTPPKLPQGILLEAYHRRVDTVYKPLHWPTVLERIEAAQVDPKATQSPSERALELAIYFTALCSLTDLECEEICFGNRAELLQAYRLSAEASIAAANLISRPNVTALQAFVVYLIGLRASQNSASAWTLLAIAVRTGNALGLGSEGPARFSAFDLQVRRRLWYTIGSLDTHASFDRGTPALLPAKAFGPPPLVINDCDMSSNAVVGIPSSGLTDMSVVSIGNEAMMCWKKVCELSDGAQPGWKEWPLKLQLVSDLEQSLRRKYFGIPDNAKPIELLMKNAAQEIAVSMQLNLRRPPYGHSRNAVPPWDDFDVMKASTDILDRSLNLKTTPDLAPWAWKSWVQWHALAIVLAELCGNPPKSTSDRAYMLARQSFNRYASRVADSDSGMLWKPISRLMHQVEKSVAHLSIASGEAPAGPPHASFQSDKFMFQPAHISLNSRIDSRAGSSIATAPMEIYSLPEHQDWALGTDMSSGLINDEDSRQRMMLNTLDYGDDESWSNWDVFLGYLNGPTNEL